MSLKGQIGGSLSVFKVEGVAYKSKYQHVSMYHDLMHNDPIWRDKDDVVVAVGECEYAEYKACKAYGIEWSRVNKQVALSKLKQLIDGKRD